MGTSFAAPWISRKLCYLIDVMGLPKEVAKALIIDAAAGWEYKQGTYKNKELMGKCTNGKLDTKENMSILLSYYVLEDFETIEFGRRLLVKVCSRLSDAWNISSNAFNS